MNDRKVWFITGTSSGLVYALAEEVLANGEKVVATARNPGGISISTLRQTDFGNRLAPRIQTQYYSFIEK